jgi:hypothetical protein
MRPVLRRSGEKGTTMWKTEHTTQTAATPTQLWAYYAEPHRWPEWDHEVVSASINGPFAAGNTGTLKPASGPKAKMHFTEVTPERSFTDVTPLPLATMAFEHVIEPTDAGCRFTHRVTITGPLSGLFGRLIGRRIAAELPTAMRKLASLAETAPAPHS